MGISTYPSTVTLPPAAEPYPSILEFLSRRFPDIQSERWRERLRAGKILDAAGDRITEATLYLPHQKIFYFREVDAEQHIPFTEKILFQNAELLVACKPHFLAVIPSGRYVEECLLHRLRKTAGNADLVPIHRIDRETAGLVLFSVNKNTRGLYQQLFAQGSVEKTYEAIAEYNPLADGRDAGGRATHDSMDGGVRAAPGAAAEGAVAEWDVQSRIVRGEPWFRRKTVAGVINARSRIVLVETKNPRARFRLHPLTGKTHQLRIHMNELGFPIMNDTMYPTLTRLPEDDFERPLQLLAQKLRFIDPVSRRPLEFISERQLVL